MIGRICATSSRSDCFSRSESRSYGVLVCIFQRKANSIGITISPCIVLVHLENRYSIHLAQLACSLSANCSINSCSGVVPLSSSAISSLTPSNSFHKYYHPIQGRLHALLRHLA